jgi:AraC-like DNA-binding protein
MGNIAFYRDETVPFFEVKTCDSDNVSYKKHSHEEYSLGLVERGKSVFWCNGSEYLIHSQAAVFIPAGVIHSCNPVDLGIWKYTMLFFEPDWLFSAFQFHKEQENFQKYLVRDAYVFSQRQHTRIYGLVKCLTAKVAPLEKEIRIIEVLEKIFADRDVEYESCNQIAYEERRLKSVKEYLQENFCNDISLEYLAKLSGLSKHYLIRSFKDKYQVPPHTFQILLRINFAKKEIRQGRLMAEVTQDAGFYDQSHFIKVFKHYVGATPEVYQKANCSCSVGER